MEGSLLASKLLENEVCIVASPALLERHGTPEHPSDFAQYPTVGYQSPQFDISAWAYIEEGNVRTVEINPICRVSDGNALLDMVLAGLGAGYLSAFAAQEALRKGTLVRLFPKVALPPFAPVFMVQATTAHPPHKLQAFKQHLMTTAKTLQEATEVSL